MRCLSSACAGVRCPHHHFAVWAGEVQPVNGQRLGHELRSLGQFQSDSAQLPTQRTLRGADP